MATVFAEGSLDGAISAATKREAIRAAVDYVGDVSRTLVLPPDGSRPHSGAAPLIRMLHEELGGAILHLMPAVGTHRRMAPDELRLMFGDQVPVEAFRHHDWRRDLARLGDVPAGYVHQVSDGVLREAMPEYGIPVEVNRRLVSGDYTAILSVGQVVPHEVVGMANGFKNVLVGAGGQETINKSHFLAAAYGIERIMGRSETPVRAILNYAHDRFLTELGILYILTVMAADGSGQMVMKGIYVGDDHETFLQAARLSQQANITLLDTPAERLVAYLEPGIFKSTWLGNKAIYRTRMAMAEGGELTIIAPGVETFGEDPQIDRLIRAYCHLDAPAVLQAVVENAQLRKNLTAAGYLIASSESRFRIVYATDPAKLSKAEVESAGYEWRDASDALREYEPAGLADGPNGSFYYVGNPALGLWATADGLAW